MFVFCVMCGCLFLNFFLFLYFYSCCYHCYRQPTWWVIPSGSLPDVIVLWYWYCIFALVNKILFLSISLYDVVHDVFIRISWDRPEHTPRPLDEAPQYNAPNAASRNNEELSRHEMKQPARPMTVLSVYERASERRGDLFVSSPARCPISSTPVAASIEHKQFAVNWARRWLPTFTGQTDWLTVRLSLATAVRWRLDARTCAL